MEKNDIDLEYLLSLPLEEYQQELGRLLVAAIDIAAEDKPRYRDSLDAQKKFIEEQRASVVK